MPLIKNPFKSKGPVQQDAGTSKDPLSPPDATEPKAISPRPSVTISRPPEPDYKLSSVSPEGTFIPPSPPEKASFLSRFRHPSAANSIHPVDAAKEDGSGFVIPRESFDGYRRSFDIRPSMDGLNDGRPSRSSLDLLSATMNSTSPRKASQMNSRLQPLTKTQLLESTNAQKENAIAPPLAKTVTNGGDNDFEDVKLDDEATNMRKKHFWQRSSNNSSASRRDRDEENELRAFASPVEQRATKVEHQDSGKDTAPLATSTDRVLKKEAGGPKAVPEKDSPGMSKAN